MPKFRYISRSLSWKDLDVKTPHAFLASVTKAIRISKVTLEYCIKDVVDIILTISVDDHDNISSRANLSFTKLKKTVEDNALDMSGSANRNLYLKS